MAQESLADVGTWSRAAWIWGVIAGIATLVFLRGAGIWWLIAILLTLAAFAAVVWIFHGLPEAPAATPAAGAAPVPVVPAAVPEPVTAAGIAPEVGAVAAPAVEPEVDLEPLRPMAEPAIPEPVAVAEPEPVAEPAVQRAVAAMPEVDMEAAQAAASARVRSAAQAAGELARLAAAPVAAVRPDGLAAPRKDRGDDLKKIKGVGPKLEAVLQRLGFWHFDQIAAWTPAELAWVDANLDAFNGRATREDWVGQAKLLAEGGETEHSRAVERGEFDGE